MSDASVPGLGPEPSADSQVRELAELREEVARLRARLGLRDAPRLPGLKLKDLLVVIGATAVGLAILRAISSDFTDHLPGSKASGVIWSWPLAACNGYMMAGVVVAMWTVTALYLRLRPPRPRLRRLARRPGFAMACGAIVTYLTVWAAMGGYMAFKAKSSPDLNDCLIIASLPTGFAAGSAWFLAALGARCRPGPDGLDRSAWLLGLYWLGLAPVSLLAIFAS